MTDLFVLVISMWGFTGEEWVYIGNQIVLNTPTPKEECLLMAKNWSWHELNEYYRFSVECHES